MGLPHLSVDDKRAVEFWEWAIEITDGHYRMDITLKSQYPDMPNNFVVAQNRLKSLGKRFFRDPDLHANYKAGSQEMLDKGYAHKVLENGDRLIKFKDLLPSPSQCYEC